MIVEAPQAVLDRIVDRLIEDFVESGARVEGYRWCAQLDCCRLDWRQRGGICPCGEELMN